MAGFRLGAMEQRPLSQQAVAFRDMSQAVTSAGLYKINLRYYMALYVYLVAMWLCTWWLVGQRQLLPAAVTIGMFWGQLSFLGHDLGHCCVHRCKKTSAVIGLMVNAFLGMGYSHWVDNHNAHHAVPNSSDCDPEVQFMPFIATSTLHFEHTKKDQSPAQRAYGEVSRHLVSWQHYSFVPLLMFARYKFYVQAFSHLSFRKIYIHQLLELSAQLFFFAWFGAMTMQLPTWQERVAWVVISHAADWLLYLQTVITHFPRDIRPGVQTEWIDSQATGTLNWQCGPWMDWFHGGLQFQIEHHLFPRIPRHNLRAASAIVKPALEKLGVEYHNPTFWGAIVETFESLKMVANEARFGPSAAIVAATSQVVIGSS